jgi:hypothetical protein
MQNQLTYDEFLKKKIKVSENFGFNLDIEDINPNLKPHNKLMVKWLVELNNCNNYLKQLQQ